MAKVAAEVGSTANRYQLLARLAAGGMAEIFLAHGTSAAGVERYCVLKRILPERARDAELVQMVVDEARLAAQLQHPNIASVHDIGMLGGSYFFTMPRALSRGPSEVADVVSAPPPTVTPAPPAVADPAPTAPLLATFEALSARYEARAYQGVVTACSTAATPAGITTICLMAACHLRDAVQAQRWLAAHPAARRAQLAATCAQLGTTLAVPR